jgi:hypothetical protein
VPLATAKDLVVAQSFGKSQPSNSSKLEHCMNSWIDQKYPGGVARMSLENMTALNVSKRIEKRLRRYTSRQISNRCLIEAR